MSLTVWRGEEASQKQKAEEIRKEQRSLRDSKEEQRSAAEWAASRRAAQGELLKAAAALQGLQRRLEAEREALRREWALAIRRPVELAPGAETAAVAPGEALVNAGVAPAKDEDVKAPASNPDPVLVQLSRRQEYADALASRLLDVNSALQEFHSSFSSFVSESASAPSMEELKAFGGQIQARYLTVASRLARAEPQLALGRNVAIAEFAELQASWTQVGAFLQGPKSMIQSRIRQQQALSRQREQLEGLLGRMDSFLLAEGRTEVDPRQRNLGQVLAVLALGFALGCAWFGRQILSGLRSWVGERSQYQATLQDWELRHAQAVQAFEQRTEQCRRWLSRVAERGERVGALADVFQTFGAALRQRVESLCAGLERQSQARAAMAEAAARLVKADAQIRQGASGLSQIASQSRILSFNASVEASRSGVAGAAFLVVADAMRQLAERSADTAAQIEASCQNSGEDLAQLQTALASLEGECLALDRVAGDLSECVEQQAQPSVELSEIAFMLKPASARGRQGSRRRQKLTPQAKSAPASGVLQMVPSAPAEVVQPIGADCVPQRLVA